MNCCAGTRNRESLCRRVDPAHPKML